MSLEVIPEPTHGPMCVAYIAFVCQSGGGPEWVCANLKQTLAQSATIYAQTNRPHEQEAMCRRFLAAQQAGVSRHRNQP